MSRLSSWNNSFATASCSFGDEEGFTPSLLVVVGIITEFGLHSISLVLALLQGVDGTSFDERHSGSGGYNSIRGGLVHQFQKEASKDLKYALLDGSQGLRQHMLYRGEILITGHESEESQQSASSAEAYGSDHEELEAHNGSFVAHNDSIAITEPEQETILEFQNIGDKNNEEDVQCDDQSIPTIRIVPRRKRTQRKMMDKNK